ncbi:MAG: hypothetical protein ABIQ30_10795, partial [Devosia sp.]
MSPLSSTTSCEGEETVSGRRNRTTRRAGGATHWVQLEHYLLDCPAYLALSSNARSTYTALKRRYNGKNNGLISFSAREAGDALRSSHHTGARALIELQQHGFIEVTENSTFDRKVHLSRQYRLTEAEDDRPGLPRKATKEFMSWIDPKSKTQSHP